MKKFVLAVALLIGIIQAQGQEIWQYPYEESFESSIGLWITETSSWEVDTPYGPCSGYCPNVFDEPESTFDGNQFISKKGRYNAYVESPWFILNDADSAEFSFGFHMNGGQFQYLNLLMRINDGSWTQIWSVTGPRGMGWNTASIQLHNLLPDDRGALKIKLRFEAGRNSSSSFNDMSFAVDQVEVKNVIYGYEPPPTPPPPPPVRSDPSIISLNDIYGGTATAYGNSAAASFDNSSSYYQENSDNTDIIFDMTGGCSQFKIDSYDITVDRDDHAPRRITMYSGLNDGSWVQLDYNDLGYNWSNYQRRSFPVATNEKFNKFRIKTVYTEDSEDRTRIREIDFFGHPAYTEPSVLELYANSGSIDYADGIPAFENVESKGWLIKPLDGSQVVLDFVSFDMTCNTDYVRVYDGDNFDAPLFDEFSGSSLPPRLVSTNNAMYIEVITAAKDPESIGQGFQASYSSTDFAESTYPWTQVNDSSFVLNGRLGINTPIPSDEFDMLVNGGLVADELVIESLPGAPDYVFEADYDLKSLQDIQTYIDEHGHLPEVPSAKEFEESGMSVSEMNLLLLKKIEELTLYLIESEEKIDRLTKRLDAVEATGNN